MGSPVIGLFWIHPQLLDDLIEDEALPRSSELGMTLNITLRHDKGRKMHWCPWRRDERRSGLEPASIRSALK